MNKLFVFKAEKDRYSPELEGAYAKTQQPKVCCAVDQLGIDFLSSNKIEVVISNGLPTEWYYILKGMNIVTITIDDRDIFYPFADIVIDCFCEDGKRYFTGKGCSLVACDMIDTLGTDHVFNLIRKLEWDSHFFGYNIAFLSCMHLTDNIMRRVDKFIQSENIKLVEYLCNCHDSKTVRVAEKNGFHFVDIRLSYEYCCSGGKHIDIGNLKFSKAVEDDIPWLKAINNNLYEDSRYYFDMNFNKQRVQDFYQNWVEKGVRGQFDDECWCLYDKGNPITFCTVRYRREGMASIGLFGVDENYQGQGVGKEFLLCVFDKVAEKGVKTITVVTQGRNYAAQRLYQAVGFKTMSTQLWYHKWI